MSDLARLNEIVNDEEVARYLCISPPVSMKSTRDVLARHKREGSLWYAITADGKVAGAFSLTPKCRYAKTAHVAVFGIDLGREYWGKGLGGKAIDYAVKKARRMRLKRIELEVAKENIRARRLFSKKGFRREGVKAGYMRIGRKYHDSIMMARLLR